MKINGWRCNELIFNTIENTLDSPSKKAYEWPDQGKPSRDDFRNWHIALEEVYGITKVNPVFRPEHRGQSWQASSSPHHYWRYDSMRSRLFQYDLSLNMWFRWEQVTPQRTRSTNNIFKKSTITSEHIQADYEIASVRNQATTVQLISTGNIASNDTTEETPNDWALPYMSLPEDGGARFAEQVKHNRGQTAGDGSCKNGRATGGFLSFEDDNIRGGIQGATEVPLSEEDSTPYSGELGGIQAAITATHAVCSRYGVQSGTITHGVDNLAALRNCFGDEEPDTNTPCFHMVKRIRAEIKESPFKWIGKKVKAHQDEKKTYSELTSWEKANVVADEIAKKYWEQIQDKPRTVHQTTSAVGWTIRIKNKVLTTNFEKKIINHCTEQKIKDYWVKRFNIPEEERDNVDWKTFKKIATYTSSARHLFILKHSAGISATGRNMLRRGERQTAECPRCGNQDEHNEHIFQCKDTDAETTFQTAFEDIQSWLQETTTQEIGEAIKELVLQYRNNMDEPEDNEYSQEVDQAIKRQKDIGLFPFMCGIFCSNWKQLQEKYLERTGSRRCAKRWTAQLGEKLIELIFGMWNHRNEILHKQENTISKQQNNNLNRSIEEIYKDLPNMRLLTATERRFFKFATISQIQGRNIHRKKQWIRKATSILNTFETKQQATESGAVQILFKAMTGNSTNRGNNESRQSNKTNKQKTNTTKNQKISKTKQKITRITQYMSAHTKNSDKSKVKDTG